MSFYVEPDRWVVMCSEHTDYPVGILGFVERDLSGQRRYTPNQGQSWFDTMDEARKWIIDDPAATTNCP